MRKRVLMTTGALFVGLCARSFVPMQGQSIHHAGVLTQASSMGGPRAAHTATTLDDGRVLVVGGFTRSETAPDAEFYDATRGTFAPAPRMRTVRHSHSATRLADGRVLIAGGYGDGTRTLASAELFDPSTNRFVEVGSLGTARANHVAVLLQSGHVLMAGGLGGEWTYLASAEVFDPGTATFTSVTPMTVPREGHAAITLASGQVLITGGHTGPRRQLTLHASAEVYDPSRRVFERVGDMRVRRHKHDVGRLQDGRVLVTGGSDERDDMGAYASTEFFDEKVRRFTAGPPMRHPRYKHLGTSVTLADGRLLVAGGAPVAETFDPRTLTFTDVDAPSRLPGLFSAVAPLTDGRVFISGGYGAGSAPSAASWVYDGRSASR